MKDNKFKNAVSDIQFLSRRYNELDDVNYSVSQESLDLSIQALMENEEYHKLGSIEEINSKFEELERWHTDVINERIKNPFAYTSTLVCHNCDHKDEYIEELEFEVKELNKKIEALESELIFLREKEE